MADTIKHRLVIVGTGNDKKVEAVREVWINYPSIQPHAVLKMDVPSGVHKQPRTLEETFIGACNRATLARGNAEDVLGVGIESGIMDSPLGYLNFTAVVISDGARFHYGTSPGFPLPDDVIRRIFEDDQEVDEAVYAAGLSDLKDIGQHDGILAVLTAGRVTRKDYIKPALQMALISLEQSHLYRS